MVEIFDGALDAVALVAKWQGEVRGCGALCFFVGVVRDDDGVSGLSFDIYEPLLQAWFKQWEKQLASTELNLESGEQVGKCVANDNAAGDSGTAGESSGFVAGTAGTAGVVLKMAHARGDVAVGAVSFVAFVASKKRRAALEVLDVFVEDFKANAPIWKYDLYGERRVWAQKRSFLLKGAGVLGSGGEFK